MITLFVNAQSDEDVFTVRTVNIFPSTIEADSWNNIETISFQNLDKYALLGEFNAINSATLGYTETVSDDVSKVSATPEHDVVIIPEDVEVTSMATSSATSSLDSSILVATSTDSEFSPSETEDVTTELLLLPNQTTTTEIIIPELQTEEDITPEESLDSEVIEVISATTTVLRRVESLFTLAIAAVASVFESSTSTTGHGDATDIISGDKELAVTGSPTASTTVGDISLETDIATSSSVAGIESEEGLEKVEAVESLIEEEATYIEVPEASLATSNETGSAFSPDCVKNCSTHTIYLSGFGLPLEEGIEVTGTQLRMSFAAKKKDSREHIPTFSLRYSIDGGLIWNSAGSILIEDEVSNSINGGYYLFALPSLNDEEALDDLQVELSYHDDMGVVEDLYLDSVWLELFTLEAPAVQPRSSFIDLMQNDGFVEGVLSGDELVLPDGKVVEFAFTDDNIDETLIIKSDKATYSGLSEVVTYFSVTNTAKTADKFALQTYFPQGVGEVTSIKEFNQNKPKKIVVPEYRPFVYNCEAGWEFAGADIPLDILELSKQLSEPVLGDEALLENTFDTATSVDLGVDIESAVNDQIDSTVEFGVPSTTVKDVVNVIPITKTTTTVLKTLGSVTQFLQFSTTTAFMGVDVGSVVSEKTNSAQIINSENSYEKEDAESSYICRNTNIVKVCDYIDGDNTACHVKDFKVADHKVINYVPGWEERKSAEGGLSEPSFLRKVVEFIGFGPNRKDIPKNFEARAHTPDTYSIQPGETKYFEMKIGFPILSSGEYWIEAVGKKEYGLLDPFWSSEWSHRLPVTLDNTAGVRGLTEHQVLINLTSGLTDFWNNVNPDGSDMRFVAEIPGNEDDTWYDTSWNQRVAVTVQSSQVSATLTDYPMYVDLSTLGSAFFGSVKSDGADIRITSSDGVTELPHELVSINTGASTGELHFKAPTISSSEDTMFYIYFDNVGALGYAATDTYGSENVWNADYLAVYHLVETSSGVAGEFKDSTSNSNDGVGENTLPAVTTGKFGSGQDFVNGHIDLGASSRWTDLGTNDEYNLSAWINLDSSAGDYAIISQWAGGAGGVLTWADAGGAGDGFCHYGGSYAPANCVDLNNQSVGTWQYIVARYDSIEKYLYLNGADTGTGPVAAAFTQQAVNFSIGSEQGDNNSRPFNGQIDEVRISSIDRGAAWIASEFVNQDTPSAFYATSSVEAIQSTQYRELDFWLQYFNSTSSEADIWVQVDDLPAAASTTVYMYYGNTDAVTASDEMETFTYSTTTDIYYVMDSVSTGDIVVYSLIDNNIVQLDDGTEVALNAGETTSLTGYTGSSTISVLGPVSLTINDAGADTVAPVSFASTTFASPTNRNTSQYFVYSPFASSSVNTYVGNSGTPDESFSVATGTVHTSNTDASGANGVIIESSEPVLIYHKELTRDSFVLYPATTDDLFGIDSNNTQVSALADNPDPTVYCSDGTSAGVTGVTRGEEQGVNNCTQGSEGAGDAVRFSGAATPFAAIQQADSDGSESTIFLPQHEFATEYYFPTNAAYAAVACSPRFGTSTIEVQTNGGATVEALTCAPSGNFPGKAYFVNGGDGDATVFGAGNKIVSTNGVPFYVIYEEDEEGNDETNIWGSVQTRKFTASPITVAYGAQEVTIDAEYEQLSFGWYDNLDDQTPTGAWSLGEGSYATEGIAITGQGAVNDEDVLRLRMNLKANVATGTVSSTAFKLQYSTSETCSLTTNTWFDLGAIGSTTALFVGYDNTSVSDGSEISSTTLASSTVFATYEEQNFSTKNPNEIGVDEVAEWDWVMQSKNAVVNTNYCFRMVRSSGQELVTYTAYPELYTAGPPLQPTTIIYFDNEATTNLFPILEFVATDAAGDEINYQVQIDDDLDFGSPAVDRNSLTNFLEFENVNTPSDKAPFDSGAQVRFTSPTSLTSTTTYWWRVRGRDPDGSDTYGDWSDPASFTTDSTVTVSKWYQTTGHQFTTNTLVNMSTSTTDVTLSSSPASLTTTAVDFDDATVGNAWGEVSWNDTETSGTILYQVEYLNGSSWMLVPDSDIFSNSTGIGTSPINILGLDPNVYDQIRVVATLTGATLSIQDITIVWGQRVETPTLLDPFDNEKTADLTPTFTFTTTDPQVDDLEYEISYGSDYTFVSSTTINSTTTPADWSNVTTPADTGPFNSGDIISYTIPGGSALTNNTTYWWRMRAKDPDGGNAWSPWSDPDVFTASTSVAVSTWFQTTQEQFEQGTLSGLIASTSDSVEVSSQVGEYGKIVVTNGDWTEVTTQVTYNNPVVVASVRYSPTGDTQRSPRVRNKTATTFEVLADNFDSSVTGTTTVDYLVMEAGTWSLVDGGTGTQVIAGTFEDVADVQANSYPNNGYGEDVTFTPAFSTAPAVIATVSTDNDSSWVHAALNDGNTRSNPPTATGMGVYMGRDFESAVHSPEDIDYIAMEPGHGTNNGSEFDADFGADSHDEPPVTAEPFNTAFAAAPEVVLVMQAAVQGANGGYAGLYEATPPTATNYYPFIDEDGTGADRNHTPEPILALSFENASGILLRDSSGGDLSGTIYSEPIMFSDGAGPKFEQLLWNDVETGTSTIVYQLQYLTSTSSWAFVPDVDLPNNSIGTTTSPIDLTGLNVSTYDTLRIFATLQCANSNCPELDDWTIEWSEGVTMSGTLKEYDRSTNVGAGTVTVSINGGIPVQTGSVSAGVWSINNVTAFAGDILTVFVDGANEANEAVAVFEYDGLGDITNVNMFEQHLTLTSDELATTTMAELALSDNSVIGDEDVFFDVNVSGDLQVCAVGVCSEANLFIDTGSVFVPASSTVENLATHDLINYGTLELDGNTIKVSGSWDNQSSITIDNSSVIFTATSTSEIVDDGAGNLPFNNLTFGETSGTATWTTQYGMDINGDLSVTYGTLARASSAIMVAKSITTGANGFWDGIATTTFDGSGSANWTDNNAVSQDIGLVMVDGEVRTVAITSDVRATSIKIGANDTLNAGGSYDIQVAGDFTNNNIFIPSTSRIVVLGDSTVSTITAGGSNLYALRASTTNGSVSFTDTAVSLLDNFELASGTVTLPTSLLQVGGSFLNTGGYFSHNNAEVRFNGSGVETIEQQGTPFLNAFNDVSFTGTGAWSFDDVNATTSNDFVVQSGTVTLPSGQLTVGGIFDTSGSGSFVHNNGEVILLVKDGNTVLTNGSDFNDVRVRKTGGATVWYDNDWGYRKAIIISASAVDSGLTNFPVYVDLSDFGSTFFTKVNSDGGDIRVTQSDGSTEVAREIVDIDTGAETGEMHFNANSISSTTNTTFYIYYGNSTVSDYLITDTYGAENTWNAGYEAVYHLADTGSTYLDSTNNSVDGTGEGTDPVATASKLGDGQSITSGRIDIGTGVTTGINGAGTYSISAWINQNTSTGDQAIVAQFDGAGDFMLWADTGGLNPSFCNYMNTYMPTDCQDVDAQNPGTWQHVVAEYDGTDGPVYVDGSLMSVASAAGTFGVDGAKRWSIGSEDGDVANRQFNGLMDEVRISSVSRGDAWVSAEHTNQSTTTDFYSISTSESAFVRTFSDTNTTILGNMIIESGEVVFPTGVLSVGGSFDNDDIFNSNNGTVEFDSIAGTETIAAGSSTFATLNFNSSGGDFTIIENATATAAANLTDATSFVLNSGITLDVAGAFYNDLANASSTWTGSTLSLTGGVDYAINSKTNGGDTYATLYLTSDTDISMWNSTAVIYTTADTSSIYSQDHAATDGALYIFGDYVRTTGTEHWSYATDFDGADLVASSSERQANVRVVNGGSVTASSSILSIIGSSTASTTIDSQSGTFSFLAQTATVTAYYFEMTGTDSNGFNLTSSSTVTSLDNSLFTIGAGVSSITVDASTIDVNPEAQFFNTDFVTGGGSANVTLSGSPLSYWWFRNGTGDRYGETFDNADGDPGSIRWDDSSYNITISGVVYADDGLTALGGPSCNGVTNLVTVVVDGVGTFTAPCSGVDGSYSISGVAYIGDPTLTVYLNDAVGGEKGTVVTKTPTADISDLNIYVNRVMTRHEDIAPLTIADMVSYDESDDSDIKFVAATGTTDSLIVRHNTELMIASSTTFTPGGNITLESNGGGNAYDGSLHIDNNATFTAVGTESHSIGGSFFNDIGSIFTAASSTIDFTATTSGKGITNVNAGTLDFNEILFTGVGGGWNITADISLTDDMTISTGTVTGTGDITMTKGTLGGNGLLSMGGGTTTILTSTTLGGTSPWTFYDLVLGDGATTSTTTRSDTATTTISGLLNIKPAHFLVAGSSLWDFAGDGTVFVEDGNLVQDTSTILYSGGLGSSVLSTTYYNLKFGGFAGAPTYTFSATGVLVENDLMVAGTVNSTADLNAADPVVAVLGDVYIDANGILEASASANLTVSGNFDNNGTFTSNAGEIVFDSTDAYTIAAGSSTLGDVTLNGTGAVTVVENATSTGLFTIASTSDFTQQSGTVLAVTGQLYIQSVSTDWTGSTLSLSGNGDYLVNPKTLTVDYENLVIGSDTDIRLWNSSATTTVVDATGSLYSQDQEDVNGDLYIYGSYVEDTRSDVWSYATDFDGADLTGGERQANVYLAAGASAQWDGSSSLSVIGSSTASTTVQNQGSGAYSLVIGGNSTTNWDYVNIRDIDSNGLTFTATPSVIGFNHADLLVQTNSGSAMTVGGTAINASPARTFTGVIINDDVAVTGAVNVTATGTSISGWRFTTHGGNIAGESFDIDPAGDPGYVIWDDSAAIISISGKVYEANTSTVSSVCDDVTTNIILSIAGSIAQNASSSCASADGAYTISGVSFGSLDELMIYIDGEVDKGIVVTKDPVSSISNMDIYENHVILRHENTASLNISDMAIWDSSDDADIQYTAVTGSSDTLTLPADTKLVIWNNKDFEPLGDVTIAGGGAGASYDGSLELFSDANWNGQGVELLAIGGSMGLASGATFTASNGTTTFTTTGVARTIAVNEDALFNVEFTGSGSWLMTDPTAFFGGDLTISAGSVTLVSGTSTFAGSLINSGGTMTANNGIAEFIGSSTQAITLGGSDLAAVEFSGGDYVFTDVDATTTNSFRINSGDITLPSGVLAIGGDFRNIGGSFTHNTSELSVTNLTVASILASGSDLYGVTFIGGGAYSFEDNSLALAGSLNIASGSVAMASGALSIGGSLDASGGTFTNSTGTILFNSSDTGEYIDAGVSDFYSVQISSPTGGYTLIANATTTNNFSLLSADTFIAQSGVVLSVNGVFLNTVSDINTTWLGSTLSLDGSNEYTINTKVSGDDQYDTLVLGNDSDIRMWNSAATTTIVATSSSLYSQDHAATDGYLNIYGDLSISTTSEYWSYATDFDGTALTGGSRRAVTVSLAANATTSLTGAGNLAILGEAGATTTVQNQGSGSYAFGIDAGTVNMEYYALRNMNGDGLNLSGSPVITSLSYGDYDLSVNGGSLITLEQLTLDSNPSLTIMNTRLATSAPAITGTNVNLSATTTNSWTFRNGYGGIAGEDYDIDGLTNCDSIRWDDSSCLLTEQTEYRWRHDDGGIDVPDNEWFNASWNRRKRIRVANNDNSAYTNVATMVTIAYDSDMQVDFDDLRFTGSDGVTEVDFWVERFTASVSADVWVEVPSLLADDTESLFVYYGNVGASSVSSSTAVFIAVDDYEDNNITEYTGQTTLFETDAGVAYGGSYGFQLNSANKSTRLIHGIARFGDFATTSQGETIRYKQYVDTTVGASDESCTLFGVQSPVTAKQNYGVCLELFGTDRITLAKNVESTDNYGSVVPLASSTLTYSTGWYEVEIDWQTNDTISVSLYDSSDTLVATTSATDGTYTAGGFGYTSWGQNGGWDSFTSRPYLTTQPTTFLGAEQGSGGATYAAAQNTQSSAFSINDVARLRVAVENTGLDITGQLFAVEFAAKGVAPSCAAVSGASYAPVPTNASCGSSAICIATSTSVANGAVTTDLLAVERNTFVSGEFVEDPSNKTSALNVNQNYYTELEYALAVTANAADQSYCFRITDNGSAYDSYVNVPELTIKFDPVMSSVTLNDGQNISLLPGTTTTVYATGTVSDLNGYADLVLASSTIYRSGVSGGAACAADNNDCYISTTESTCSFTSCGGNSCTVQCYADVYFHADPTDTGSTYDGQEWLAFVEVEDSSGGYDFASALGVELNTLRAIDVNGAINYGALAVNSDTGSVNASTSVENQGNVEIDLEIYGTDMTDGASSAVPASDQKFSTSTFTYASCGAICNDLSSTTPVSINVDLAKPATDTPPVSDDVLWGIFIPFGVSSVAHQGTNVFTPIDP